MPRIIDDEKEPRKPDAASLRRYRTVPFPAVEGTLACEVRDLRNLQACRCGHDRCCHTDYLGEGDGRVMVLDCPSAGNCGVGGCECQCFTYDGERTSPEGRKRRAEEVKVARVVPPEVPKGKVAKRVVTAEGASVDPFA